MHMTMPDVFKCLVGNVSYALLRQRTSLALKVSILRMVLYTPMVLMVPSGFSAINARIHTMSPVCVQINQNQQHGPFYAASLSVNCKRVGPDVLDLLKRVFKRVIKRVVKRVIKRVIKRVTVWLLVAKEKKGKPRKPKERRGKDGHKIGIRRQASAGKNKKEQSWSEADIDKAFDLWEKNSELPPGQRKSKRQISIQCGVPYTTICERLSGRWGGGRRGKIAGGKRQARILETGTFKRVTEL